MYSCLSCLVIQPWQAGMDDLTHPEMVLSRHPAGNGLPVTVAVSGAWLRASDHKPLGDGLYHKNSWLMLVYELFGLPQITSAKPCIIIV